MPISSKTRSKAPKELKAADLAYRIDLRPSGVSSTEDMQPVYGIIGQKRAIKAIEVGLTVRSAGYNIFVTGLSGTGRTTTIKHLLERLDREHPNVHDICYVNDFKNEECSSVLVFQSGDGGRFKKDMDYLITSTRKAVPKIFLSDDYKDRQSRIVREFEGRQKTLIQAFENKLTEAGFVMVQLQTGVGTRNEIQPLIDKEPTSLDRLEQLNREGKFPASRLDELRRLWDRLRREFDVTSVESKKLGSKVETALEKLDYSMIAPLITDKVNLLRRRYPEEKVQVYLDQVLEVLTGDLDRFREASPRRGEEEAPPYRKREPFEEFAVNLIRDSSEVDRVPVVIEKSPSYKNLFGSLERVVDRFGYWRTDFTRIFGGSLLEASGGYLVLNAQDVLIEPGVWTQLKRALRNGEIEIAGYDPFYMMAGAGIKPEPIPINVKVVMIGEPRVYHLLWNLDEDFKKCFKVKAEFDSTMDLTSGNTIEYYRFVRNLIAKEDLRAFDISGMQAVAEYGRRITGRRDKLSTRFNVVADVIREASFCASRRNGARVTRKDVQEAVGQKRTRLNLVEDKLQEMYDDNVLMVSTSGESVGQINGLSVYNMGDYSFGRPARITVSTAMGKAGVINIERESDLSGPTHNKGVLILAGYLREMFAQQRPIMMSASISFEQSYSGIDGDSASSTEIYAILSSLSRIPIKQGIAVTGSVNQKGEIQPIGGVNEKVEGFFDICAARRLTGDQGVMIPHQNASELMLRPDVVEAIRSGKFHIYPVKTITQGIEVLTGVPGGRRLKSGSFTKGSVFAAADDRLAKMAESQQQNNRKVANQTDEDVASKKKTATKKKRRR